MFPERTVFLIAVAGAAVFAAGSARTLGAEPVSASQPTYRQLIDKVDSLETQVEQLKDQLRQQQHSDDQVAQGADVAAVPGLRQEAEAPAFGLSPRAVTAGYDDNRFIIQSADKRFVLRPWLQFQTRYESTYLQDAQHGGKEPLTQSGWEIRRLKFGFDGNAITPDLTYMLQFAVDRRSGVLSLEQAFGKYRINGSSLYLKAGQYKEPLDHEQLLASRNLTALDRTLTNDLFANSEGFVQGVSIGFDNGGAVRGELAFTDGQRSANTNFQQFSGGANAADYGIAGRADYKPFGDWKDYDRSTGAYDSRSTFLVAGVGVDYTEAGDTHTLTHVVDVDFGSTSGFALYGAYTGRAFAHAALGSIGSNGGATGKTAGHNGYDWSLRAQASYAIDIHWEPYLQYEYIHLDPNDLPAGVKNQVNVIRAGVNYYLFNTTARITLDANYLPGGSPVSDDGIGLLPTGAVTKTAAISHGGGSEFILRAQFQLNL